MFDKADLFRVCLAVDGQGRGAYVCKNADCLTRAKKAKGLERSLKRGVPQEMYERLATQII